jgi:DNA gyrase/topoisomerase IV subunit B
MDEVSKSLEKVRRYSRAVASLSRRIVPDVLDAWYVLGGHRIDYTDRAAVEAAGETLRASLATVQPDLHVVSIDVLPDEPDEQGAEQYQVEVTTLRDGEERYSKLRYTTGTSDQIVRTVDELHEVLPLPVVRKGDVRPTHSWRQLLSRVLADGRKGYDIQRYKGLGEMNPDQLWETTLDPESRTLLQVRVDDLGTADHIFSVLMGDAVDPRRNFIQDNALNVRNLDI